MTGRPSALPTPLIFSDKPARQALGQIVTLSRGTRSRAPVDVRYQGAQTWVIWVIVGDDPNDPAMGGGHGSWVI